MEPWLDHFARANFLRSSDTAHDLKTPLNVAVLNLELLRMRLRKLGIEEDDRVEAYTRAVDHELRRMGQIFDAFFLLSTPPKDEGKPQPLDLAVLCAEAAGELGFRLEAAGPAAVDGHASRVRQAVRLFFDGASRLFPGTRRAVVGPDAGSVAVTVEGPVDSSLELTKIFKFYYSDSEGSPDLSLAVARLITETYGGELKAAGEHDKVTLRLSFPQGAR